MRRIELEEHKCYPEAVRLDGDQLRELTNNAHGEYIDLMPSPDVERGYFLKASHYIGAVSLGDLAVIVRPKVPIDRVMFLITYAMDPRNWRNDSFQLGQDEDFIEAMALAFAHRTRQSIHRGLLRGYRGEEDALYEIRGSIRLGDQIGKRFDMPLPIEVAFDEYTEDIDKNRMLKTAIDRLGHTFIRSEGIRREVRSLRPAFTSVALEQYRRGLLPQIRYTRLEEHYRPAVELARLIIDNSSLELLHGKVAGAAFFIDMNKVFEEFLYVALRETLELTESQWRHEAALTLDEGCRIRIKPDLSWWPSGTELNGSRPIFVGDAKYKNRGSGFENADIYQMLAYCTATGLHSGLLVYAAGESEPGMYKVRNSSTTIEVVSIDLKGTPEAILDEVSALAERIKILACQV